MNVRFADDSLRTVARFILRYLGAGELPDEDLARVRALCDSRIVDQTPRMLLVDAAGDHVHQLVKTMPQWAVAPETVTPLPDTRKRIGKAQS